MTTSNVEASAMKNPNNRNVNWKRRLLAGAFATVLTLGISPTTENPIGRFASLLKEQPTTTQPTADNFGQLTCEYVVAVGESPFSIAQSEREDGPKDTGSLQGLVRIIKSQIESNEDYLQPDQRIMIPEEFCKPIQTR